MQTHEHLDAVEPLLLEVEKTGRLPADVANEIFRAVHSVKGSAGFLGLRSIAALAHALEGLLARLRDGELAWQAALADPLLRSVDALRELLGALPEGDGPLDPGLLGQLEALAARRDPADRLSADCEAQRRRGHGLAVVPLPAGEPARAAFRERLRRFAELVREDFPQRGQALVGSALEIDLLAEALGIELSELQAWSGSAAPDPDPEPAAAARAPDSIRVRVELLDRLMDLAGELVLLRNQLCRSADDSTRPLARELDRVTGELQHGIQGARLQPIRVLFERLPRMVRDIGQRLGKPARLEVSGGGVELDRSLLEALSDPLTHLLRNALDHGLESGEQRIAAGKPPLGALALRALAERGRVRIELEDDGAGIDVARVRTAALQRGVIGAAEAGALSEREALALIFAAGVSTAAGVSELSGRGVGLDVVRTNIERLGGRIDVETRPGQGTRFRIDVPLTLAIVPALIVSSGDRTFALPQSSVVLALRLGPGSQPPERVGTRELLRVRGLLLPLVRLAEVLRVPTGAQPRSGRARALVLRCGEGRFALAVDDVQDGAEIVVKPLPPQLAECGWYSGCTVLPDGRPALILDPAGVARSAGLHLDELPHAVPAPAPAVPARSFVLFDAASGQRFALPLAALLRVEALRHDRVERIGGREYFAHGGRTVPLIHLHEALDVGGRAGPGEERLALIPRATRTLGIAAARIVDTVVSDARPDPELLRAPGILGAARVAERLTLFLDPAALAETAGV